MATVYTNDNFKDSIKEGFAVVDFYADWCGPCKMFAPTFDEVAGEMSDKLSFGKVDVDATPELAQEYGVQSIPTLVFFKDGKEVSRSMGATDKEEFVAKINEVLNQ